MKKGYEVIVIVLTTIVYGCNRIDFSNPEEVIKGFSQFANKNENGTFYDDFLSAKSKEFVTKDEFVKSRTYPDSVLKTIKIINRKVEDLPVDVDYPTYRRFKIDETILNKKDTFKTRDYYTLLNENGKWKVIWTNTLASFADQKSFNGDCSGARKTVEKIIELNPFDGSAYALLATCYYRDNTISRGEMQEGVVKNIKYALTLEEDCSSHYNTLASYYSSMEEYDLAIQCRLTALQYCLNESDETILYSNIGNSYMSLGDYANALEYFKKSVQIDPDFPDVWFRLGMLMEKQNNLDKAMEYFEKSLSLPKMENSLQGSLYSEYAKCCYEKNNCSTAKEYINKALVIDPSNEDYQYQYKVIQNCRQNN